MTSIVNPELPKRLLEGGAERSFLAAPRNSSHRVEDHGHTLRILERALGCRPLGRLEHQQGV